MVRKSQILDKKLLIFLTFLERFVKLLLKDKSESLAACKLLNIECPRLTDQILGAYDLKQKSYWVLNSRNKHT